MKKLNLVLVSFVPFRRVVLRLGTMLIGANLIAVAVGNATSASVAPTIEFLFPEPGLTNPKLRFHTGGAFNNAPELYKSLPEIPGSKASAWFLTQWRRPKNLSPLVMAPDPAQDPLLGKALYYFPSEDEKTHLKIYRKPALNPSQPQNFVYELFGDGGNLERAGGTNVFLSADATSVGATFEKSISYSVDMKLSEAEIFYDTPSAKTSGAVMAQVFTGFIVKFQDPKNAQVDFITLYMQIYHNNTSYPDSSYRGCYRHGDKMEIVYGNRLQGDPKIAFKSSAAPPQKLAFKLNDYLCDMISRGFDCDDQGRKYSFNFPPAAKDFKNWRIGSMYLGIETQDTDLRPQSTSRRAQGKVHAAIQISNLMVTKDHSVPFKYPDSCRHEGAAGSASGAFSTGDDDERDD